MSYFAPVFDFEERWSYVQKRIKKLQDNLEGLHDTHLTSEDNIMLYTDIYNMCTLKRSQEQMYEKYKQVIHEYITSTVLPSLEGKKDEVLLRELLRRWSNHKAMTIRLSWMFSYLDKYCIPGLSLPSLKETSFLFFYDLVYDHLNNQVKDAILAMIDQKILGETVDETLVNNTLKFYSEIGEINEKIESKEFVETMMRKISATF